MSFKKFLKKHGLLSCILAFPFLGVTAGTISSQVTPPSVECMEQLGIRECKDLMIERLTLAKEFATYKWNQRLPLNVEAEKAFVQRLIESSNVKILDPASMERFFAAQLDASQAIMIEHFESWVNQGVDKHITNPDSIALQNQLDAIDVELMAAFNRLSPLLCGHTKEELKIALSKALLEAGFSRDVIDAATHF